MNDKGMLTVSDALHPVSLEARVEPTAELLRAPASGLPCVYWRLRVVEHLTARSELVHDLASPDAFELAWGNSDGRRPPVRIRLEPDSARIEATPSLHRSGTPGAVAVARAFGFRADITVEEVLIRPGEEVTADGVLQDLGFGAGPFRAPAHEQSLALAEATVRLQTRALAPAMLIPWAFGTAAALLGGMGLATWGAWRYHLAHLPAITHNLLQFRAAPGAQLTPPDPPHQRFP